MEAVNEALEDEWECLGHPFHVEPYGICQAMTYEDDETPSQIKVL